MTSPTGLCPATPEAIDAARRLLDERGCALEAALRAVLAGAGPRSEAWTGLYERYRHARAAYDEALDAVSRLAEEPVPF